MALQLVSKANTLSKVWTFFGFEKGLNEKPKNDEIAICRLCMKEVSSKGRNTSNLYVCMYICITYI